MKWKGFLCLIILATFTIAESYSYDQVSHKAGKVTLTQTDHYLATPVGRLPIIRNFKSDFEPGILGPGWSLQIISRLDRLDENLLIITQAGKPTLLAQKANEKVYEGPGGVLAKKVEDKWIVKAPNNTISIYDDQGRETFRSDVNGNTVTFEYNQKGHLFKIQAVKGYPLILSYNQNDLLTAIKEPSGRQSRYRH